MDFLPQLHAVSSLQDSAADLIGEAKDAPVGITRYGKLVAALISPEDLAAFQELKRAAERAFWTLDVQRAARDLAAGEIADWGDVVTDLRAVLGGEAGQRAKTKKKAPARAARARSGK